MSKSVAEQQILKLQFFKNIELTEIKQDNKNENDNDNDIIYLNNGNDIKPKINSNLKKKTYNQLVKDIKTKLNLLNQLIE